MERRVHRAHRKALFEVLEEAGCQEESQMVQELETVIILSADCARSILSRPLAKEGKGGRLVPALREAARARLSLSREEERELVDLALFYANAYFSSLDEEGLAWELARRARGLEKLLAASIVLSGSHLVVGAHVLGDEERKRVLPDILIKLGNRAAPAEPWTLVILEAAIPPQLKSVMSEVAPAHSDFWFHVVPEADEIERAYREGRQAFDEAVIEIDVKGVDLFALSTLSASLKTKHVSIQLEGPMVGSRFTAATVTARRAVGVPRGLIDLYARASGLRCVDGEVRMSYPTPRSVAEVARAVSAARRAAIRAAKKLRELAEQSRSGSPGTEALALAIYDAVEAVGLTGVYISFLAGDRLGREVVERVSFDVERGMLVDGRPYVEVLASLGLPAPEGIDRVHAANLLSSGLGELLDSMPPGFFASGLTARSKLSAKLLIDSRMLSRVLEKLGLMDAAALALAADELQVEADAELPRQLRELLSRKTRPRSVEEAEWRGRWYVASVAGGRVALACYGGWCSAYTTGIEDALRMAHTWHRWYVEAAFRVYADTNHLVMGARAAWLDPYTGRISYDEEGVGFTVIVGPEGPLTLEVLRGLAHSLRPRVAAREEAEAAGAG